MKLIAETAWHHDGDFDFLKNLVTEISIKTQADYVKLHILLNVDEYVHTDHPGYEWMVDRTFSELQWDEIFQIVLSNNKKLMLLFNDKAAIDFGMKYKPELVEIHSVCLNDIDLLEHLNSKTQNNTKIILGVGGSDLYEIENATQVFENRNIVLMHGFQNYPTQYADINFGKVIKTMQLYSNFEHGYADHTGWDNENNILITLLGANLGMQYIEKHVTTAYGEERVDWQAAINIEMFNQIAEKLDVVSKAYGDSKFALNAGEQSYSTFGAMKKAAILCKEVKKGDTFTKDCFSFKRTGQSSDLSQIEILAKIDQKISKDLILGHCINSNDFE